MKEIGTIKKDSIVNVVNEENAVKFSKIFRSIFELEFGKRLLNELDYTYDIYLDYMEQYNLMDDENKAVFDENMRYEETVILHSMEIDTKVEEETLLKSLVDESIRKDSIAYISKKILDHNRINVFNVKKLHTILMEGIAKKGDESKSFRLTDNYFVGYKKNKEDVHVQYFPPLAKSIDESMNLILTYLNDPDLNKMSPNTYLNNYNDDFDKKYALFLQPIISLALIIILQAFTDGNSRTAKTVSYASMLNHTNQIFEANYKLPLLYLSSGYVGLEGQYRNLIKNIAVEPTNETWNEWVIFNLHSIQSYIDTHTDIIKTMPNNSKKRNM